jgi:hypothetical protein
LFDGRMAVPSVERAFGAALTAVTLSVTIALSGCGSSGTGRAEPAAVITTAGAKNVLAQYTAANNRSNELREATVLASYEAGSSYQIDAGAYANHRVTDPANHNYAPLSFVRPVFYIPRQTGYPAWFAVRAHQQDAQPPKSGSSSADLYLLFTRSSATAKWLQVLDPYVLSGTGSAPQVAADPHGNALQIAPSDAGRLALAPGKLPGADAGYLDAGSAPTAPLRPGLPTPKAPGPIVTFANGKTNLGDLHDQAFFQGLAPGQLEVQDVHATTADPVYALQTTGGGALVFYDLSATLTISTLYGQLFSVKYSGFISGTQKDANFEVEYREQFAVYEPAGAPVEPQVVAENSGPMAAKCGGGPCT